MTKKLVKTLLLAAAGFLFSSIYAPAAVLSGMGGNDFTIQPAPPQPIQDVPQSPSAVSNYSDLDALLGFRVLAGTGIGFEGIIDLGPVSQFNHTFTLGAAQLGDIGGFMTSNFGSDWYTRMTSSQVGKTDIQWAVVATDNGTNFTNDLWSTRNPAVRSTPWTPTTGTGQATPSNDITAVGSQYSGQTIATGTTSAIKESSSGSNTWTAYQPGGTHGSISFDYFNPTDEGSTNTVLAFDHVQSGTASGVTLGTFTWNSDGTVTFTVVPEPAAYQLMGLGALGLIGLMILRRRRTVRA